MDDDKNKQAHQRKDNHLDLAKQPLAKAAIDHPFDSMHFRHYALPSLHLDKIDITTRFLSKKMDAPFFIGAMTVGTDRADAINRALAEVAQSHNIGLALGSQRAGLSSGRDQSDLRKIAPDIPLIGNLGITQLASPSGHDMALRAIEAISADAMAIHLNPLQEAVQPEGDHDWRHTEDALASFIALSPVPVIIKEVGAGLHPDLVAKCHAMGAAYCDVAGLGGTNWTRIEAARRDDNAPYAPFLDWGIPLDKALISARQTAADCRLIASGGLRHGLDVAKSLALGADIACAAGPFLKTLEQDDNSLDKAKLSEEIANWKLQIRLACFLTNCEKPSLLSEKHVNIN